MHTIKITITKEGKVESEVQGVKGTGCDALLTALLADLGSTEEEQATSEFYEPEASEFVTTSTW